MKASETNERITCDRCPTLSETEAYLKRYLIDSRLLEAELRHQKAIRYAFEAGRLQSEQRDATVLYCRARMYEIKEFVRALPDCEEKVFLFSRYLCGESIARIAEDRDISLRSAYRLRHRALVLAAGKYAQKLRAGKATVTATSGDSMQNSCRTGA